ncbi:MAG: hypothetical protein MJ245_06345 [Clostridia bacterium]|nr:hypothetical protein [Clostridia bacterium]
MPEELDLSKATRSPYPKILKKQGKIQDSVKQGKQLGKYLKKNSEVYNKIGSYED